MNIRASSIFFWLLILVAGTAVFFYQCSDKRCTAVRRSIENTIAYIYPTKPCAKPITYTTGIFDAQFGISKKSFLDAVKEAEAIWEKPFGTQLFAYAPDGALKINLMYDYRQQTTSKLKSLGIVVNEDKSSFDALKIKYDALKAAYTKAKADYEVRVAAFTKEQDAYNQEVSAANKNGGASRKEYQYFQEKKAALQQELSDIHQREAALNAQVDDINAVVQALNRLGESLNLNVEKYNEIGTSRGEQFIEGEYQENSEGQKINIYEFSSHAKLVRVLAHELGHALGLPHVTDTKAIMYKLNTSANGKLTGDDINALKARCAGN